MRTLAVFLALAAAQWPLPPSSTPPPPPPTQPQQQEQRRDQPRDQPRDQARDQRDQTYTFKSDVSLVTFTATVTDQQGRYVRGLRKDAVAVWEDGVRQQISLFRAEYEPVSLGIVFDTSGSMEKKIEEVADAVAHFAATAERDDEMFLMRFSSRVELVQDFTDDRNRLARAAYNLRPGGATVLYDAVAEALEKIQTGRHRKRALVVITDGEDTSSHVRLEQLQSMANRAEVLLYCVGIGANVEHRERNSRVSTSGGGISLPQVIFGGGWPGSRRIPGGSGGRGNPGGSRDTVDMEVLRSLAEAGGARAYQINPERDDIARIDDVVQEISSELRQQYSIGYYPSNAAHDGTYRRIQITTSFPDFKIRARRGYYAPQN